MVNKNKKDYKSTEEIGFRTNIDNIKEILKYNPEMVKKVLSDLQMVKK